MQFLTSVAEKQHYSSIFGSEGTLQALCEKVVVPNMQFRPSDEEVFETDPDEYIRRDIEGSGKSFEAILFLAPLWSRFSTD